MAFPVTFYNGISNPVLPDPFRHGLNPFEFVVRFSNAASNGIANDPLQCSARSKFAMAFFQADISNGLFVHTFCDRICKRHRRFRGVLPSIFPMYLMCHFFRRIFQGDFMTTAPEELFNRCEGRTKMPRPKLKDNQQCKSSLWTMGKRTNGKLQESKSKM